MAQTGFTPIQIYSSSTAAAAPVAGSLTNSTLGSELAINITDGKLFYKDNANAIQVIGWKTVPTTAGGTGLTSYTAGDLIYYASGAAFTKLAIGAAGNWMGSSGTAPQWNAPAALTKTDDTNVTLTLGGSASTALLNAASLTLGWTGQLAVTRGGTGLSTVAQGDILYGSAANTLAALAKNTSATRYLSNTGASNNPAWAQVDLSNGVTGTLPVTNGGTGLASLTANRVLYASATNTVGTSANFLYDGTNLILGRTNRASAEILTVQSATDRTAYFINTHATNGDIGVVLDLGANTNNATSYHLYCTTAGVGNVFNIYGNGTYGTVSDAKLKKNITSTRDGYLDDLCKLRVVKYNWITQTDDEQKELGFIAQELETVFPGLVQQSETNKMVKLPVLIPMLVKALQELKSDFDAYRASHP